MSDKIGRLTARIDSLSADASNAAELEADKAQIVETLKLTAERAGAARYAHDALNGSVKDPYEAHKNRSEAMKGNQNAKKDGMMSEEVQNGGKENHADAQNDGVPAGVADVWAGGSEGAGDPYAVGGKVGDNGAGVVLGFDQSGAGLTDADGNVNRGRGRITKGQARKIRAACREILKKPDSDITEADKRILAQYVGAGGTGEEGGSNSGALYEFYTPRTVISKVWQLVDKYNPRQDKRVIEPSSGIGRFAEGRSEPFTLFCQWFLLFIMGTTQRRHQTLLSLQCLQQA